MCQKWSKNDYCKSYLFCLGNSPADHFIYFFFFTFDMLNQSMKFLQLNFILCYYKYFTSYLTRGIKMVAFTSSNSSRKSIHLNYTKNSLSHVKIQLFKVLQSWYLMTGRVLAVQPSPKTWTIWGSELFWGFSLYFKILFLSFY